MNAEKNYPGHRLKIREWTSVYGLIFRRQNIRKFK